jgi:hypothetical protein
MTASDVHGSAFGLQDMSTAVILSDAQATPVHQRQLVVHKGDSNNE